MSKEERATRICPVCNSEYLAKKNRLKHGRQTTCSRKCSYRLRADGLNKSVLIDCATCGSKFLRTSSKMKSRHGNSFCSKECHYKGRGTGLVGRIVANPYVISEAGRIGFRIGAAKTREKRLAKGNYTHTEKTKAILSEKTSAAIAEGRLSAKSGIEDLVARELDRRGVPYQRQVAIRETNGRFAFVFDFMLSPCIALEVNGTFWHTDKRFYPDGPKYEVQSRGEARWNRKIKYAKAVGIEVLVIWEHDLKQDLRESVDVALKSAKEQLNLID